MDSPFVAINSTNASSLANLVSPCFLIAFSNALVPSTNFKPRAKRAVPFLPEAFERKKSTHMWPNSCIGVAKESNAGFINILPSLVNPSITLPLDFWVLTPGWSSIASNSTWLVATLTDGNANFNFPIKISISDISNLGASPWNAPSFAAVPIVWLETPVWLGLLPPESFLNIRDALALQVGNKSIPLVGFSIIAITLPFGPVP